MSNKNADCVECHRNMPIVGRGLCGKCYGAARAGLIEMPPSKRKERKTKSPDAPRPVPKKCETKAGYFETLGLQVDTLVKKIEAKGVEIETIQKQHTEMRVELLKGRHNMLDEIERRALEKMKAFTKEGMRV